MSAFFVERRSPISRVRAFGLYTEILKNVDGRILGNFLMKTLLEDPTSTLRALYEKPKP